MATFGDVRRRTILLFVLGIALPSTLLGYLAFRGIRNDQALLERERRERKEGWCADARPPARAPSQSLHRLLAGP